MSDEDDVVGEVRSHEQRNSTALSVISAVQPRNHGVTREAQRGCLCIEPRLGESNEEGALRHGAQTAIQLSQM